MDYTSQYPPAHSVTYVGSYSAWNGYMPWFATNPLGGYNHLQALAL